MSPRRNRPRGDAKGRPPAGEERDLTGVFGRRDSWRGEDWLVRQVGGAAAAKHYRCPGCDQEIPPGVPHVVVWPDQGDVDDRRHWHTACWNARDRRGARIQRGRNAPRY
ncbi:ATP/GTP-binding protein [Streptomyces sp. NPDC051940]|uniref:ATP/GTP-binding protein n=1 Tax=Streptomyces sp. NPDC051940 TaxID=3155675 RepID=UPI0034428CC5